MPIPRILHADASNLDFGVSLSRLLITRHFIKLGQHPRDGDTSMKLGHASSLKFHPVFGGALIWLTCAHGTASLAGDSRY